MPGTDLADVALAGLAGLFGFLALVGCFITLATLVSVRLYGRRPDAPPLAAYPAVTILKPLYGDEPGLAENLSSFFRQTYPSPVEIVFGVQDAGDPAIAVAQRVAAAHPAVAVRIVVDGRRHGQNGKVSNLVNMEPAIGHPVVVLADSDIRVGPDYLRQVVEALEQPGVGLVTCLYRGAAVSNLWSRMAAASIDDHFLPNVVFALSLRLTEPCFGSTIALRRQTLAAIGGFLAFKDLLADDNAMGHAVRALNLTVVVPARPVVEHLCAATTPWALFRQELRWSRTIQALNPGGFAGSIVTYPLPLAAIAWLFDGFGLIPGLIVVAALACRRALQVSVRNFSGATARLGWLGPLRDGLSFAVFVASFWPGTLEWRGHSFDIDADGTMAPPGQTGS